MELGEELLRLGSADNFRDLTGPGLRTADGRALRPGLVYRSSELALSEEDAATVAGLGVTAILDLRHAEEIDAHPDVEVAGATWEHHEIPGIPMERVAALETPELADALMLDVYRGFVRHPGARAAFAAVLERVASADAPLVFHCTAGKDRTGMVAALLLEWLGVPRELVLLDYERTNDYRAEAAERDTFERLVAQGMAPEAAAGLLSAPPWAMEETLVELDADFGGAERWLREQAQLEDAVLNSLREQMLV